MRPNQPQVIQGHFLGSGPKIAAQARPQFPGVIQRHPGAPQSHVAQAPVVQRMGAGKATQIPANQLNLRPAHTGQRLPEAVQRKMETVFGASFADVRIHVGHEAISMGARAFTHGSHIYFAPGQYQPTTPNGQRLLGHELAHVVQQKAGRVKNPFRAGVAVVQDPGLEAEADRMAMKVARMPMTPPGAAQPFAPGNPFPAKPLAPNVQAAVVQAKPAHAQQPFAPTQLTTAGPPQVIQGKFSNGFAQIIRFHHQSGTIQPKTTGSAIQLAPALAPLQPSGGRPIPVLVQRKMEKLFGADFNHVRIHEGPEAQQIGAKAFTMGSHIYFAPGQYNPTSAHGQRLLGHELAHVVQQRSNRVQNPFGSGMAVVQDLGLEAEAERMGLRAAPHKVNVQAKLIQCLGRNPMYRGPEIMVKMYRGTDYSWEKRAMETGRLMSKGLRDFRGKAPLEMASHTMDTNTGKFGVLSPRELRNLHSIASMHTSDTEGDVTPTSNYVSLTDDPSRVTEWGSRIYRFDMWRSDLWKGGVDWDRGGLEAEWLAEGGTRIYNVEVSIDKGRSWQTVPQQLDPESSTFFKRSEHVH